MVTEISRFLSIEKSTNVSMSDSTSNSLLLLLYSLGFFEIRECILFWGLLPQKRWNGKGNLHEITLLDTGLNQQCVHLFSARIELEQAIKSCIQNSMIIANELEDCSLVYSLTDDLQTRISRFFKQKELILQGLIFTTHIYPREEILHDS